MKVNVLLESGDYEREFKNAWKQYPFIGNDHFQLYSFIIDLPKEITKQQLDQLVSISLPPPDEEFYIETDYNVARKSARVYYRDHLPLGTWASLVEFCEQLEDDDDFKD